LLKNYIEAAKHSKNWASEAKSWQPIGWQQIPSYHQSHSQIRFFRT
jgi:hypothetical protein